MTTRAQQLEVALTHFRAGITALFRTWPALKAAVQSEWGGIESHAKADDLRSNIFEHYNGTKADPLSLEDLEDNLLLYLEEEFSVVLEDESERQIADLICRLYKDCSSGNFQLVEQLVQTCLAESGSKENITVQENCEMESDDEEDNRPDTNMGENMMNTNDTSSSLSPSVQHSSNAQFQYNLDFAKSFSEGPLFLGGRNTRPTPKDLPPPRQLGEPEPERQKVELDDDGFAPVAPRRSRRVNKGVRPGVNC